jgi:hypothetical protein
MRKKTPLGSSPIVCAPDELFLKFSHCAIFGGGPCIEWNGKNSELRWRDAYDNTWHLLPPPSEIQWKAFWLLIDQSSVRNWEMAYSNPYIMDGIGWGFRLSAPRLQIETSGSNAYPGSDGPGPLPGSPFDILSTAIGILVGCDPHELKALPGSRNDRQIAPDSEIDSSGSDVDPLV